MTQSSIQILSISWPELLALLGSEAPKGSPLNPAPAENVMSAPAPGKEPWPAEKTCCDAKEQPHEGRLELYRKLSNELDTMGKCKYELERLQKTEKSLWEGLAEAEAAAEKLIKQLAGL